MGDGYVSGPDLLARSLYFRSSVTNFCTLADWFAAIRNSMAVSSQLKYSVMSAHPPKQASVLVSKTAYYTYAALHSGGRRRLMGKVGSVRDCA